MLDKKEVIRLFLKSGFQISKKALPLVLTNPNEVIRYLKTLKPRPFIVTEIHIKRFFKKPVEPKIKIETLKVYKKIEKPIRIEDYANFFYSRYEKIKNILSKHMINEKLISINKITKQTNTFSIIGIVKNKNDSTLLLEDLSGETCIYFEDNKKEELKKVAPDDVVGVNCKKIKEKIYGKKIIFPDILSSREISKTEQEIKFGLISNPESLEIKKYQKLIALLSTEEELSLVFLFMKDKNNKILEDFSKFESICTYPYSNPSIFKIRNIKIMVLPKQFFGKPPGGLTPMRFMISILRRRVLPTNSDFKKIETNGLVLEHTPDIIISDFDETDQKNYKGTTIISNSDPEKIFLVNLKNREVLVKII